MKYAVVIFLMVVCVIAFLYLYKKDYTGTALPFDPAFNDARASGTVPNFLGIRYAEYAI